MQSHPTRHRAVLAAVGVTAVLGAGLSLGVAGTGAASAQDTTPPTSEPPTSSVTLPPSSSTTQQITTSTTARPVTTSTTSRPSSTTTAAPTTSRATTSSSVGTSTTEDDTGTTRPAAVVESTTSTAPPTSTTQPAEDPAADAASSGRPWGVVGGLIALAGIFGLLTVLYWRHTKPEDDGWYYDDEGELEEEPTGDDLEGASTGAGSDHGAFAPDAAAAPLIGAGAAAVATGVGARDGDPARSSPIVDAPTQPLDVIGTATGPVGAVAGSQARTAPDADTLAGDGPTVDGPTVDPSPAPMAPTPIVEVAATTAAVAGAARPTVDTADATPPAPTPNEDETYGGVTMADLRRRAEAAYQRQTAEQDSTPDTEGAS